MTVHSHSVEATQRLPISPAAVLRLYYAALYVALGVVVWVFRADLQQIEWVPFAAFIALDVLAEVGKIHLLNGGFVSVGFAILVAAIAVFPPVQAGLIAGVAVLAGDLLHRESLGNITFNFAQVMLTTTLSAAVYHAVGGRLLSDVLLVSDLPPLALASALQFFLNLSLVLLAISIDKKTSFWKAWTSTVRWSLSHFVALAVTGLLLITVYLSPLHFGGLVLLLLPLFGARYSFQHYGELREAHLTTVRSLAAALDAKDPYTRGHSERVATVAVGVGRQMGLGEEELQVLEQAGLLHDIGKIGIPDSILHKDGPLTPEEWQQVQRHPVIGADILKSGKVSFLTKVSDVVRHHHERYDGRGYPDGLQGKETNLLARILAVADAFDAMTMDRAYRPGLSLEEAVKVVLAEKGRQFDPEVAEALLRHLEETHPDLDLEVLRTPQAAVATQPAAKH